MKSDSVSFSLDAKKYTFSPTWIALLISAFLVALNLFRQAYPSCLDTVVNKNERSLSRSSGESSIDICRSPRNQTGTWIGNTWIPPKGWKLYSTQEMQDFYKGKSILWIGDSTGRRASMAMFSILNSTSPHVSAPKVDHPSVININKGGGREKCMMKIKSTIPVKICRKMPSGDGKIFLQAWGPLCAHSFPNFIQNEINGKSALTRNIDLIVVSMGVWDGVGECGKRPQEQVFDNLKQAIDGLDTLQKGGKTIIWRTSGFAKDEKSFSLIQSTNQHVMDTIDQLNLDYEKQNKQSNFTYVNWGGAVEPRSQGPDRINGDNPAHYGCEPRLALIQMITNVLSSLWKKETTVSY